MQLYRYHDSVRVRHGYVTESRFALLTPESTGAKLCIITLGSDGLLKRRWIHQSDRAYLAPLQLGKREARKATASLRRIAKKKGTLASIRQFLKGLPLTYVKKESKP